MSEREKILVSTEELFALYRGIAAASTDPTIGLLLGTEDRFERYDPLTVAAVSSTPAARTSSMGWAPGNAGRGAE